MKQNNKLTDIHAHFEQYETHEMEAVLKRADEAGVRWVFISGLDLETSAS